MPPLTQVQLDRLALAVNPVNGLVGGLRTLLSPDEANPWYIEVSSVGRPRFFAPDVYDQVPEPNGISGAGGSMDPDQARGFAIIEGIERYASCVFDPSGVQLKTWRQALFDGAFHWSELPRLSKTEFAHPACPIVKPDPDAPLRWIEATNLANGDPAVLPLIMTHLHVRYRTMGEKVWLPISTGVAAHSTADAAICSGLIENIERDAISLTWIHELPLAPLDPSGDDEVQRVVDMGARAGRRLMLFDASLDHSIPIVYCVDISERSPLRTVVSCAADLSFHTAALKALREATSCRVALENTVARTEQVDEFIDVFDGAVFMGRPEQAGAFDFLVNNGVAPVAPDWHHEVGVAGKELTDALVADVVRQTGSSVYATSLTTSECRDFGLEVWRVVTPGLQPLSFSPRAQFRTHPRVQEGPARAGFIPKKEEEQNVNPQPFA